MALNILTKEIWQDYTPEQQKEYIKRLFISRKSIDDPWQYAEEDETQENYIAALFAYYRIVGFPYY